MKLRFKAAAAKGWLSALASTWKHPTSKESFKRFQAPLASQGVSLCISATLAVANTGRCRSTMHREPWHIGSTPLPMHSLPTQDLSQRTVETHSDCGFFVRALLSAFADIAQPFQVHADARLVGLHLAWGWSPELMHVIWSSNGGHGLTRCSCEGDAVQMGPSLSPRYAHESQLQPHKAGIKRNINGQENVCHQSLTRWKIHPGC